MPITAGGGTSSSSIKSALKRGFTIMELVIVIAVIAVLAAVLIPTFANITNRANESANEQTVTSMNRILMAESVENPPEDYEEVRELMKANGYTNLTSNIEGQYFGWLKEKNAIVLYEIDGNDRIVVYPEEYASETPVEAGTLFALREAAATPEEFVQAVNSASDGDTITLDSDMTIEGTTLQIYDKDLTLDLGGNNLTFGDTYTAPDGEGGTYSSVPKIYITNYSDGNSNETINIVNGTIIDNADEGARNDTYQSLITIDSNSSDSISLDNVTVISRSGNYALYINNNISSSVTLHEATIQGMCVFTDVSLTTIDSTCTFIGNEGDDFIITTNTALTIEGGTFTTAENQYAIFVGATGSDYALTIKGGTFTGGRNNEIEDTDEELELIGLNCTRPKDDPTNRTRSSDACLEITDDNNAVFNGKSYIGKITGGASIKYSKTSATEGYKFTGIEGFNGLDSIVGLEYITTD